jgi:hypothetical protein
MVLASGGGAMFRKLSIFGLAGVLVLVGGGLATALAGNHITSPETLVLTETQTKTKFIDAGKPGYGPGDVFLFVSSLTDKANGSKAGSVRGQCTQHIGHWQTCEAGAFLGDRGEIFVAGVIDTNQQSFDIAITGGTGEFDNARGTVHIESVSDNVSTDTVNLIP